MQHHPNWDDSPEARRQQDLLAKLASIRYERGVNRRRRNNNQLGPAAWLLREAHLDIQEQDTRRDLGIDFITA